MHQEDYVSLETAKLLKEVGFNLKCKFCYVYEKFNKGKAELLELYNPFYQKIEHNFNNKGEFDTEYYEYYSQPHLYDAAKWLREVHKIHVVFMVLPKKVREIRNVPLYNSYLYCEGWNPTVPSYGFDSESYEQTLDEGIQEACKNLKSK